MGLLHRARDRVLSSLLDFLFSEPLGIALTQEAKCRGLHASPQRQRHNLNVDSQPQPKRRKRNVNVTLDYNRHPTNNNNTITIGEQLHITTSLIFNTKI